MSLKTINLSCDLQYGKNHCILNLLESCLTVLIECINDLEHDKRRAQINDAVRRELWQRAEKSQAALFFSTSTHVVSVSYQRSTDADKEKSSAGDRAIARLQETRQEANVHKHTRAHSLYIDLERK